MEVTEVQEVDRGMQMEVHTGGEAAEEPIVVELIDALPYHDRDMERVPGTSMAVSFTLHSCKREVVVVCDYADILAVSEP